MSSTQTATAVQHKAGASARVGSNAIRQRLLAGLPVTERRLELAGISTAVLEGGKGAPMVLLHGPGEYAAKWLRVIPDLVKSYRVIVPDLPGHGTSEAVAGPVDQNAILDWLAALIENTCPEPPILVGQILGGAIAARFAATRSDAIRCLILADSLGLAPFQPAPEFGSALMEFVAQPDEDTHDRLWQRCAFDLDRLRDRMGETWTALRAYNLDRAQVPSLKPTQQALMEQFGFPAIPAAELARIAVPTALIWGRHDLATPLAVAEAASAEFGWPLHVIEDAADDPPVEQPDAFLGTLHAVLGDELTPSGGKDMTRATRQAWDRIAAGYDEFVTPTHELLGEEGLRRAKLEPGMRFLDVAAGSGALSIPAARIGAEVLATDLSAGMLERLRARAAKEGLKVATRVMDGHALELEDDSFDIAGSQFGVMLFPDMPRGIAEMARVVKPGGRVLMTVFGDPRKVEFLAFLVEGVRAVRPEFTGPPMDPPPLPFQLRDPEVLRRELARVGLRDVRVETTAETMEFSSGAQLWAWLTNSNPIVEGVLAELELTEDDRAVIRQALDRLVRERASSKGVAVLTSPINIGIGTK